MPTPQSADPTGCASDPIDAHSLPGSDAGLRRAAIIGAGPVGLALALMMARHCPGWSISLFDARPLDADISGDPRALALSLGSLQTLQQLGVWPIRGAQSILEVLVSQDAPAIGLWQTRPEVVLRAQDLGVEALGAVTAYGSLVPALQRTWAAAVQRDPQRLLPRFGHPVRELKSLEPGVEVDAGIVERFDLAVVAEGGVFMRDRTAQTVSVVTGTGHTPAPDTAHAEATLPRPLWPLQRLARWAAESPLERLRALAPVERLSDGSIRHDYHQTAWVGPVWLSGAVAGRAIERFSRQGPVAVLPLPPSAEGQDGGLLPASLVWCVRSDDDPVAALDEAQRIAVLNSLLPESAGRIERMGRLKSFALGLQAQAGLVQPGGIVRIGNAAQTLHPVAGQGLNLGLRDAGALVQALRMMERRHQSLEQALAQVQSARSTDRWSMIAATDFLARSFTWTLPGAATARALGLLAVEHLPGLKPGLARQMMFGRR